MERQPIRTLAGRGPGEDQFQDSLRALAVDANDRLYAVGDRAVKVYDEGGSFLRQWATAGPGWSVTVAADGTVWVGQEGRVEVFDAEGRRLRNWQDEAGLGRVTALAVGPEVVWIADARDRCLRRFDREGALQGEYGRNTPRKGFLIPNGVLDFALDEEGILHVAHPGKHRVERYGPNGELLGHFGRFDGRDPEGFPGCCNPTNLTLGAGGEVVVAEKAGPRIKRYDQEGHLLEVVSEAFDPSCKNMDVAVDSKGRIHVADTVRLTVSVFGPGSREDGR